MEKSIDNIVLACCSMLAVNLTTLMDIETIYTLFVQSLIATATIGKILYDVTNKNDKNKGGGNQSAT